MKTAFSLALVLVAACGGAPKPADTTTASKTESGDHGTMMPEIVGFHDVLSPRWHAEKGPERMKNTCAATAEFQLKADAIAKATPPAGADAAWAGGAKELTDAVVGLDGTCKANDATAFETAFERLHNGFHAVMKVGGGKHEKHEKHEGHDDHGGKGHGGMGHDEKGAEHKM